MIVIRDAVEQDLPAIIALLADDPLGKTREDAAAADAYSTAFKAIVADPNNELLVVVDGELIVGTMQITGPGNEIRAAYDSAMAAGKYVTTRGSNHYARTNQNEYWAEGVQDWFDTNETASVGYYLRSLQRTVDVRGLTNEFLYDARGNLTNAIMRDRRPWQNA